MSINQWDRSGNAGSNYKTPDGISPFLSKTELSQLNPAYFSRLDDMINLAAANGLQVVLNAWDTEPASDGGTLLAVYQNNGLSKVEAFGTFLGNRYKSFPNIIWQIGNDFQDTSASDNQMAVGLIQAILAADPNHLMTTEQNYVLSMSLDDSLLAPMISLNGLYDQVGGAYVEPNKAWNKSITPSFLIEGIYENSTVSGLDPGTGHYLRMQSYETFLGGGLGGQIWGNGLVWDFASGWTTNSARVGNVTTWAKFLKSIKWWLLVPDQANALVTNPGTYNPNPSGDPVNDNHVVAALASDHSFGAVFAPNMNTFTVNLAAFTGATSVTAKWFEPILGTYTAAGTFVPSGTASFQAPALNNYGSGDWVLLLTTSSTSPPPPPPPATTPRATTPRATTPPATFPGNTVVSVPPGTGTLNTAVSAHQDGNTTFMLSSGTYVITGNLQVQSGFQFIGQGPSSTVVNSNGHIIFECGNVLPNNVQIWGLDMKVSGYAGAWDWNLGGSNILIQNCHIEGYAATTRGRECFPIFMSVGGSGTNSQNVVVDSCHFTPAGSGNVDGTTVIAMGAPTGGAKCLGHSVTNCTFDTPTDHGTAYYHCVGDSNNASGCTFTAPSFAYGAFYYAEPGSWAGRSSEEDDSGSTYTITSNNLILASNYYAVNDATHSNGRLGTFIVTENTVTGGELFRLSEIGSWPPNPAIQSVTLQHNNLTDCKLYDLTGAPAGAIGTFVTSPNP
jgi:hypothetical protein